MADFTFGLDNLEFEDDIEIGVDNDTYVDQADPAPIATGNYRLRALSFVPRTTKEGKPVKVKDKYPVFVIPQVEVVEGLGEGVTRKVGIFQDVNTEPKQRYGGNVVSDLGDLTRSYGTPNWSGLTEGIAVLREAFDGQALFTAQLDWSLYDSAFIKAAIAQLNIPADKTARSDDDKKVLNAIYNAGKTRGMRFFPFNEKSGTFSHIVSRENMKFTNPVSNSLVEIEVDARTLEARPTITRYYSNVEYTQGKVKLGPFKVKPAQQKGVIA